MVEIKKITYTDNLRQGTDKINSNFDTVVDEIKAVDDRVDTIIVGGGPDKDPELVDVRNLDSSYTPQREINVAGDVTRDMQAQLASIKDELEDVRTVDPSYTPQRTINTAGDVTRDMQAQIVESRVVEVSYNGVTRKFKNESTTLYVAPDEDVELGSDGLSDNKPIKLSDIEIIFNALKNKFPVLLGNWKVKLVSGLYQGNGTKHMLFLENIDSVNWIEFEGPSIPLSGVPLAILDGKINGDRYCHGMFFQNMNVRVTNIKFQNFTEGVDANITTGSRAGLALSGEKGRVWATNIHAYNCSWGGIVNQGMPRLYVQGGLFENCRQGIASMFNTTVTIGYRGSDLTPESDNTRFINNVETGIILQSQTNGHIDYCIFEGNARGVTLATSSEVNLVKNIFRNNNIAVSAQSNSRALNSSNVFVDNSQNYEMFYSGYVQQTANSDHNNRRRQVDQLLDTSSAYFVSNAPSGGGIVFSQKIPTSSLLGRGKMLHFIVFGRVSNLQSNTCNIIIKADDGVNPAVTLQSINVPTTGGYQHFKGEFILSNFNPSEFTYNSDFYLQATGNVIDNKTGVTLDAAQEITITIELEVNGDPSNTQMNLYRVVPRVVF